MLIETSGNQPFIFGTNKQRENIGASELTTMIRDWANEVIDQLVDQVVAATIGKVADQAVSTTAEPVLRVMMASGKVVLLVTGVDTAESERTARRLITEVTLRAARYAPSLAVDGAFVPVSRDDLVDDKTQRELLRRVHAALAGYTATRPAAVTRFPQVPFAAICRYSGLPATVPLSSAAGGSGVSHGPAEHRPEQEAPHDARDQELSLASRVKRTYAGPARTRMLQVLRDGGIGETDSERLYPDLTKLEAALVGVPVANAEQNRRAGGRDATERTNARSGPLSAQPGRDGAGRAGETSWIGVVHADVNGMGRIFQNLDNALAPAYCPDVTGRVASWLRDQGIHDTRTLAAYGEVSTALDKVTKTAYVEAAKKVLSQFQDEERFRTPEEHRTGRSTGAATTAGAQETAGADDAEETVDAVGTPVPVVPIVLGGDDVSVLVAGRYALVFAVAFLREFEERSRRDGVLRHILVPGQPRETSTPAQRGTGRDVSNDAGHDTARDADRDAGHDVGLTAAAGVALVKWQFPFSQAYNLAEQLCSSAKKRGRDRSYVDWHILYETNVPDLDHIRARLTVTDNADGDTDTGAGATVTRTQTRLTCRPAMVSGSGQDDPDRHWQRVLCRAAELTRKDQTGARVISRSHAIALREQLRVPSEAEKLWAKISSSLSASARATLGGGDSSSLFWSEAVRHPEQSPPDGVEHAERSGDVEESGSAEAAGQATRIAQITQITGLLDAIELVDVLPESLLKKNQSEEHLPETANA